jgi:nucleotide-binding universal stress UspA family protein
MISNVAVAVDGSGHAQRASEMAAVIAAKFGARAHLIYVMPRHEVPADIKDLANMEHAEAGSMEMEALREKIVVPVMATFREAGVAEVEGHVLTGNPVATMLDYIKNHDIDMIFTGRRGLGPIEGVLLGSVSSKLNHHADCTVVTVK